MKNRKLEQENSKITKLQEVEKIEESLASNTGGNAQEYIEEQHQAFKTAEQKYEAVYAELEKKEEEESDQKKQVKKLNNDLKKVNSSSRDSKEELKHAERRVKELREDKEVIES
jgi:chromosome segregation ATPase